MEKENQDNAAAKLIFGVLAVAVAYAVLRYHIAGPVPWKDLPFYILNKGLSLAAFVLIASSLVGVWLWTPRLKRGAQAFKVRLGAPARAVVL